METVLRKVLCSILLTATLVTASVSPVLAASPSPGVNATSNGIEILEKDFSDTLIYVKYYLTTNGETTLYTEYGKIAGDTFVLDTVHIKVDEYKTPIPATAQKEHTVTPMKAYDVSSLRVSRSSCEYKAHTETFSFKVDKWTLGSLTTVLVAVIGLAAGEAGVLAGAFIDAAANGLISAIPDNIYFDGERCVSHSVGKVYYRYRGNFYSDSSKSVLVAENISWSRRWGH